MLHRILHRLLALAGYCPVLLAAFMDQLSPHGVGGMHFFCEACRAQEDCGVQMMCLPVPPLPLVNY
jgi:hypothetical protein